ncbi:hypothetical protein MBLNU230_g3037t1 [Neophaeotheca triangularis]
MASLGLDYDSMDIDGPSYNDIRAVDENNNYNTNENKDIDLDIPDAPNDFIPASPVYNKKSNSIYAVAAQCNAERLARSHKNGYTNGLSTLGSHNKPGGIHKPVYTPVKNSRLLTQALTNKKWAPPAKTTGPAQEAPTSYAPTNSTLGKKRKFEDNQQYPKSILKNHNSDKNNPTHTLPPWHPDFPHRAGLPTEESPPKKKSPLLKRTSGDKTFFERPVRVALEHDTLNGHLFRDQYESAYRHSHHPNTLVIDHQNRPDFSGSPRNTITSPPRVISSPRTLRLQRQRELGQDNFFYGPTLKNVHHAIITTYSFSRAIVNGIVRVFRGAPETFRTTINAISTDGSDRKRRAVERADGSMEFEGLPGYYPDLPQDSPLRLLSTTIAAGHSNSEDQTPPATPSPPASSSSGESQRTSAIPALTTTTDQLSTETVAEPKEPAAQDESSAPETKETSPTGHTQESIPVETAAPEQPAKDAETSGSSGTGYPHHALREPFAWRRDRPKALRAPPPHPAGRLPAIMTTREKSERAERRKARRDASVESLLTEAQKLTLLARSRAEDEKFRTADELVAEERRKKQDAVLAAEEQRLVSEQLREEARLKEERIARVEAEKAAERARLAAERARKQAAQGIVPVLSASASASVSTALANPDPAAILAKSADGLVDLKRGPVFERILPANTSDMTASWLNDDAVNSWFAAICARKSELVGWTKQSSKGKPPPFTHYNSAWYKAAKDKNWDMKILSRWSRRQSMSNEKLLQCEKIFFPVNTGAHWTLLIVSPRDRKIEYLDSMGGRGGKWANTTARAWLKMELGEKYVADEWRFDDESVSQMQLNSSDCGVFACWNGLAAAKGREFEDVKGEYMMEAREAMAAVFLGGGFKGEFELEGSGWEGSAIE